MPTPHTPTAPLSIYLSEEEAVSLLGTKLTNLRGALTDVKLPQVSATLHVAMKVNLSLSQHGEYVKVRVEPVKVLHFSSKSPVDEKMAGKLREIAVKLRASEKKVKELETKVKEGHETPFQEAMRTFNTKAREINLKLREELLNAREARHQQQLQDVINEYTTKLQERTAKYERKEASFNTLQATFKARQNVALHAKEAELKRQHDQTLSALTIKLANEETLRAEKEQAYIELERKYEAVAKTFESQRFNMEMKFLDSENALRSRLKQVEEEFAAQMKVKNERIQELEAAARQWQKMYEIVRASAVNMLADVKAQEAAWEDVDDADDVDDVEDDDKDLDGADTSKLDAMHEQIGNLEAELQAVKEHNARLQTTIRQTPTQFETNPRAVKLHNTRLRASSNQQTEVDKSKGLKENQPNTPVKIKSTLKPNPKAPEWSPVRIPSVFDSETISSTRNNENIFSTPVKNKTPKAEWVTPSVLGSIVSPRIHMSRSKTASQTTAPAHATPTIKSTRTVPRNTSIPTSMTPCKDRSAVIKKAQTPRQVNADPFAHPTAKPTTTLRSKTPRSVKRNSINLMEIFKDYGEGRSDGKKKRKA